MHTIRDVRVLAKIAIIAAAIAALELIAIVVLL